MPGASFVDGSFARVACILREVTHSRRATDCLSCRVVSPSPVYSVCGFGVLSLRLLYTHEKARGSPVLAGFGFA